MAFQRIPGHQPQQQLLYWTSSRRSELSSALAITSGIHTSHDVIKGLMAGANVTVMQLIGAMSQQHCVGPAAFESAYYMKMLQSYRPLIDPA